MTLVEFRKFLREHGKRSDFETPEPREIRGWSYFEPQWVRFESMDGTLVIDDFNSYYNRIPSYIIQNRHG